MKMEVGREGERTPKTLGQSKKNHPNHRRTGADRKAEGGGFTLFVWKWTHSLTDPTSKQHSQDNGLDEARSQENSVQVQDAKL